ncbi:hypothetical protein Dimus_022286, partial [Dionaea muscipula]
HSAAGSFAQPDSRAQRLQQQRVLSARTRSISCDSAALAVMRRAGAQGGGQQRLEARKASRAIDGGTHCRSKQGWQPRKRRRAQPV